MSNDNEQSQQPPAPAAPPVATTKQAGKVAAKKVRAAPAHSGAKPAEAAKVAGSASRKTQAAPPGEVPVQATASAKPSAAAAGAPKKNSAAKPLAAKSKKSAELAGEGVDAAHKSEADKKAAAEKKVAALKKTLARKQAETQKRKQVAAADEAASASGAAISANLSEAAANAGQTSGSPQSLPTGLPVNVVDSLKATNPSVKEQVAASPGEPVAADNQASSQPLPEHSKPVQPEPVPAGKRVVLPGKLLHYMQLMRLDKPIGILLLLWPTLWALWLAAKGVPSLKNFAIFVLGVVVMRSAGCVINDFADRKIDGRVARTRGRPLATGAVTSREAILLFLALCLVAFGLVLCTDPLTIKLSVGGLVLAFCYPFMKRHTHLPQVVLGAAFAWGVPMAYAAQKGVLDKNMWLIYSAVVLWTVVYDTFYAMVDRADDLKIGVKSTAILFGEQDRAITGALQLLVIYALVLVAKAFGLGWIFYLSLVGVAALFGYQQWLIRRRDPQLCFKAFLNNNWVGALVFLGIAVDLAVK